MIRGKTKPHSQPSMALYPEYSEDDRPEIEISKTRWDVYPSDSQIVLVKKESKQ
jgi:hypothetical protein